MSLEARIEGISLLAKAWLKPRSIWMRNAQRSIPKKTPYSSEMVEACLRCAFERYTQENLAAWARKELPDYDAWRATQRKILVVLPSTVFAAAWQAATAIWLSGNQPILKPSRREPIFAELLRESARKTSKHLPIDVQLSIPRRSSLAIAYGNDGSLHTLRTTQKFRSLIEFGSKFSVAVIGKTLPKKEINRILSSAAEDVVLYETQGCLSPQCFYVEQGGPLSALEFAQKLFRSILAFNTKLPPKTISTDAIETESFWQKWRFRASQGKAHIFGKHVIFQNEFPFEPCSLKRIVFVKPIRNVREIPQDLGKAYSQLSSVGFSDSSTLNRSLKTFRSPKLRLCLLGDMQRPPPDWQNGGIHLLRVLSKIRK
jgi:hypothetical protein